MTNIRSDRSEQSGPVYSNQHVTKNGVFKKSNICILLNMDPFNNDGLLAFSKYAVHFFTSLNKHAIFRTGPMFVLCSFY